MEIGYKTAKFVGKEKELPKEVYEYIYEEESYEDYMKEKEDKWISQGGGIINFGRYYFSKSLIFSVSFHYYFQLFYIGYRKTFFPQLYFFIP